jgi:4,5-dihydroxyphthalate decarboxylase
MPEVPITIACGNYDRVQAIKDGRVKVEGCAVTFLPLYPEEIFHRVFKFQEFDVSEISFSSYIRTVAAGTSAYIGIPAFVSRIFRHSGIYIRNGAGIRKPEDLRGKRIGLPEYQITAVVWMRGMLQHEYGVHPKEVQWRSGGQEQPGRGERTPLKPIPGLDLKAIPDDKTLVEQYPWLATSVYKAFCEAKERAMIDLTDVNALMVTLPFLEAETKETMAAMGRDFWRYGVRESLRDIEALTQYSHEQGLVDRRPAVEELFARSTLEMSKI